MKKALKYSSPVGYLAVKATERPKAESPADIAEEVSGGVDLPAERKLGRKERKTAEHQVKLDAFRAAGGIFECQGAYKDNNRYKLTVSSDKIVVAWSELGLMGRTGMDTMPIENVTGVMIQGGRVFKHVTIQGMGQSMTAYELNANNAEAAKHAIERLMAETKNARAQPQVAAESVSDRLLKLGQLRDAGVLTVEEFEAKKADLLDQL